MSGHPPTPVLVVGVVKDARTDSLRRAIPPNVFVPYDQDREAQPRAPRS